MRVVEINIVAISDDRPGAAVLMIEENRAGVGWNRMESYIMPSDAREGRRRILLADNQRLVIEPHITRQTVVYDPKQMAARPVDIPTGLSDEERERAVAAELERTSLQQEEDDKRRHAAIEQAQQRIAESKQGLVQVSASTSVTQKQGPNATANPAGVSTPSPAQGAVSGARSSKDMG